MYFKKENLITKESDERQKPLPPHQGAPEGDLLTLHLSLLWQPGRPKSRQKAAESSTGEEGIARIP